MQDNWQKIVGSYFRKQRQGQEHRFDLGSSLNNQNISPSNPMSSPMSYTILTPSMQAIQLQKNSS